MGLLLWAAAVAGQGRAENLSQALAGVSSSRLPRVWREEREPHRALLVEGSLKHLKFPCLSLSPHARTYIGGGMPTPLPFEWTSSESMCQRCILRLEEKVHELQN